VTSVLVLGGRCCPGPVPPVPPWSSVVQGTAPLVGISPGKPSKPAGRGRPARHSAGPHRLLGATSGGGIPATAGSPIPSMRPPRGARTAALGRNTCKMGEWRLGSGAAFVGCWVGKTALPTPPSRTHPFPWGPLRGARHHVYLPTCQRVQAPGGFPSVPPGDPEGHPVYPLACPRVPVQSRLPLAPPGGPEGRDPPGEVAPGLGRPSWLAPPPAGGIAPGGTSRGCPARKGGVWLPTGCQWHLRLAPRAGSVDRPACAPTFRADSQGAGCPCVSGNRGASGRLLGGWGHLRL